MYKTELLSPHTENGFYNGEQEFKGLKNSTTKRQIFKKKKKNCI